MRSRLVRKLAYELAGAFFDNADVLEAGVKQRSERFRLACKDQQEFIARHWTNFVPAARKILAHQLNDPNKPLEEKELIFDALLEDRGFASGERPAAPNAVILH